ncbi:25143_t:CDS:1, partial [Racocetra persica]
RIKDEIIKNNPNKSIGFDKSINNEEIEYSQHVYNLIAKSKPHY